MRLGSFLFLLFSLAGISFSQDTNFPVGPQYLNTFGSPLFLRPIATPSLTLGAATPTSAAAEAEAGEGVELSISPTVATPPNLFPIYYGQQAVSPAPAASEIEMSAPEASPALPPGFFDVGVTAITSAQSLRELGYGVSVAQDAAYWKAHKLHAVRVFTNADIERLHRG